jgi:transmembrane sensor
MSDIISLDAHRESSVEAAARDWVMRLTESNDAGLTAACAAWRDADPAHDEAFWRAWTAWNAVGATEAARASDWRAEAEALRVRRSPLVRFMRSGWKVGVPAGLAASVAAYVAIGSMTAAPALTVATRVAETRIVALNDGSKITVGGKSSIEAFTDPKARRVRLDEGQAFFEVAHDPAHPFVVVAGDAEITVLGTKFDVKRLGDDVKVNVLEGRVEVRRRGVLTFLSAGSPDAVLTAGQASELAPSSDAFAKAAPAVASAGEWRSGRLYYADAPLSDIVADARRYSSARIELSGEVSGLSLTVSYRAGDMKGLSDSIEAALPVRVERRNDGLVIVPAPGG